MSNQELFNDNTFPLTLLGYDLHCDSPVGRVPLLSDSASNHDLSAQSVGLHQAEIQVQSTHEHGARTWTTMPTTTIQDGWGITCTEQGEQEEQEEQGEQEEQEEQGEEEDPCATGEDADIAMSPVGDTSSPQIASERTLVLCEAMEYMLQADNPEDFEAVTVVLLGMYRTAKREERAERLRSRMHASDDQCLQLLRLLRNSTYGDVTVASIDDMLRLARTLEKLGRTLENDD